MDGNSWLQKQGYWPWFKHGSEQKMKVADDKFTCVQFRCAGVLQHISLQAWKLPSRNPSGRGYGNTLTLDSHWLKLVISLIVLIFNESNRSSPFAAPLCWSLGKVRISSSWNKLFANFAKPENNFLIFLQAGILATAGKVAALYYHYDYIIIVIIIIINIISIAKMWCRRSMCTLIL